MTKRLTIALLALVAFVLVAVLPVAASLTYMDGPGNWTIINPSQTVFIGEQGLNVNNATLTAAGTTTATIYWYTTSATATSGPSQTLTVNPSSFFADPNTFSTAVYGTNQQWYVQKAGTAFNNLGNSTLAFVVADPSISLDIRDISQDTVAGKVVSGSATPQGNNLTFTIGSNLWPIFSQRNLTSIVVPSGAVGVQNGVQGFVNIKVISDQGATFSALKNAQGTATSTYDQNLNSSLFYWGDSPNNAVPANLNWKTDYQTVAGVFDYPAGVYTVYAEVRLDFMKTNYKDPSGADYSGKTVSASKQVTIVSDTVQLAANKDTVVRGNPFSVTVTGKPNTYYFLFLKGISSLTQDPLILSTGQYGTAAPTINAGQSGVFLNTTNYQLADTSANTNDPTGNYTYQSKLKIQQESPAGVFNVSSFHAIIKTDDSGKRTVQFSTTRLTKDQKFTIRVERDNTRNGYDVQSSGTSQVGPITGAPYANVSTTSAVYAYIFDSTPTANIKSDEVDVTVQKGTVTVVAAGDQNYYLGEEIKLSGTNTESKKTYLYMTGPNVGGNVGASLTSPFSQVVDQVGTNMVTADVLSDNTWSYKWQTQNIQIDAGTYTVYAVSDSQAKTSLANATYGTVSVVIKKPFVSATASQSNVAKGDRFYITGTAEGNPSQGVQIWMLGKNYVGPGTTTVNGATVGNTVTQTVNADGTFSYEVKQAATKDLATGQYFVVVQHPMYNNQLDILYDATGTATNTAGSVYSRVAAKTNLTGTQFFQPIFYLGTTSGTTGSLQGSDAAEALIDAINSANVDDTYTKLSVLIEQPTINVDPIPDHYVGDKFTITGTTNLAVGDNILVEVTSSSFKPTQKTQSGEFSGSSGTVQAVQGTNGANTWSFDIDASTYKPDEYLVKASAVEQDATGTALFNILEGTPATATPTPAMTVVATTVATPVQTAVPTTATPTPTPTQPGFGALVALIGLGAVAFLVVRRN